MNQNGLIHNESKWIDSWIKMNWFMNQKRESIRETRESIHGSRESIHTWIRINPVWINLAVCQIDSPEIDSDSRVNQFTCESESKSCESKWQNAKLIHVGLILIQWINRESKLTPPPEDYPKACSLLYSFWGHFLVRSGNVSDPILYPKSAGKSRHAFWVGGVVVWWSRQ